MPLPEEVTDHLDELTSIFSGRAIPLVVDSGDDTSFEVPAFEVDDDDGHFEVHPWQFAGTHTGSFLGIRPQADVPPVKVSFNGVTIRLPGADRWMTFIDSGDVMAQLGVTPGRTAAPQPVPPQPPGS